MTREIKFRAKLIGSKEWICADGFVVHEDGTVVMTVGKTDETVITSPVISETVGQYTGLKDKNGKEIYEGDVCTGASTHFQIEFTAGAFCSRTEEYGCSPLAWVYSPGFSGPNENADLSWLTVIGNVHDNPELI